MNISRFVLLPSLLIVNAGCATDPKTDVAMDSWLGSNVNELRASWGPPESSAQLPGGETIYTWTSRGRYTTPGQTRTNTTIIGTGDGGTETTVQSTTTGGGTLQYVCHKSFAASQTGEIIAYDLQGNGCSAVTLKAKSAQTNHNSYW